MDQFDFVIVGAGAAGEAAAFEARRRGASVAVVDRDLVGGSCAFWACMPSKSLLHSAVGPRLRRRLPMVEGVRSPRLHDQPRAIATTPTIGGTSSLLENAVPASSGARRGSRDRDASRWRRPTARSSSAARNRHPGPRLDVPACPPSTASTRSIPGRIARRRRSASCRESFLVLGGGPTGVELAQVYERYGVPTTIVEHNPRLLARDHPRNSAAVEASPASGGRHRSGPGVRARPRAGQRRTGRGPRHRPRRRDVGHRARRPAGDRAVRAARRARARDRRPRRSGSPTRSRRTAACGSQDGLYVIGDPAGPEMHTHTAHYQGEMAVRMALGDRRPARLLGASRGAPTPTRRRRSSGCRSSRRRPPATTRSN